EPLPERSQIDLIDGISDGLNARRDALSDAEKEPREAAADVSESARNALKLLGNLPPDLSVRPGFLDRLNETGKTAREDKHVLGFEGKDLSRGSRGALVVESPESLGCLQDGIRWRHILEFLDAQPHLLEDVRRRLALVVHTAQGFLQREDGRADIAGVDVHS